MALRRRLSTILVAFVLASCLLIVGGGTQDKAQALPVAVAPIIGAVGSTLGAPASVLAFNPIGFAVVGVAGLGWLAYDNREALSSVGQDAWDWITGADPDSRNVKRNVNTTTHVPPPPTAQHYADLSWDVSLGGAPHTVTTDRSCMESPLGMQRRVQYGDDVCSVTTENFKTTGGLGWRVVCKTAAGGFRVDGKDSPINAGWNPTTGALIGWAADDMEPRDVRLCGTTESIARVTWFHRDNDNGAWKVTPGEVYFGEVPIEQRMDRTCALISNPGPLNNITVTGAISQNGTLNEPKCPEGYTPIGSRIHTRVIGDRDWSTIDGVDAAASALAGNEAKYAECMILSGTQWVPTGACQVAVWIDGKPCAVGVGYCWDWQSVAQSNPLRKVECRWGTTVLLPLEDCGPLGEAYRTGYYTKNPSGPGWYSSNPDGTPSPYTGPNAQPDPTAPQPAPNPNPGPTTGSNPGGDPNANGGGDPDGEGENCWAAMISWNPVDWVVTPVKCALVWAFVPGETYMADTLAGLGRSWDGTIVGTWFGSVTDVAGQLSAGPSAGGCLGPGLTVSMDLVGGGDNTMHPFATCTQPMSTVAAIVRAALTVGLWLGVCFLGVRFVAAAVGLQLGEWGKARDDAPV